jgi:threonine dehydrogenase-like Zn-dependent dehydrogenase
MRALFGGGNGPSHFRDIPEPTITSAVQAIVRPVAVAVCDLDIAYLIGLLPTEQPYAFGHEFTAVVVDIGDAVTNIKPGDRVTVPFQISCGGCNRCRSARSLDCSTVPPLSTYGLEPFGGGPWGGACADFVLVPYADAMCVPLPDNIDPIHAASVSDNLVDGYRSIAPYVGVGDEVLVLGSASVGLYAVATASALRVPVTYVDDDPVRLACAERLGAHVIQSAVTGQSFGEFPVTSACVSTARGLISALRSTEPGGTCHSSGIQFFGVPDIDYLELYRRGIRLETGRANARDDIPAALDLIVQGRLDPALVTGNIVRLDDTPGQLETQLTHKTIIDLTS